MPRSLNALKTLAYAASALTLAAGITVGTDARGADIPETKPAADAGTDATATSGTGATAANGTGSASAASGAGPERIPPLNRGTCGTDGSGGYLLSLETDNLCAIPTGEPITIRPGAPVAAEGSGAGSGDHETVAVFVRYRWGLFGSTAFGADRTRFMSGRRSRTVGPQDCADVADALALVRLTDSGLWLFDEHTVRDGMRPDVYFENPNRTPEDGRLDGWSQYRRELAGAVYEHLSEHGRVLAVPLDRPRRINSPRFFARGARHCVMRYELANDAADTGALESGFGSTVWELATRDSGFTAAQLQAACAGATSPSYCRAFAAVAAEEARYAASPRLFDAAPLSTRELLTNLDQAAAKTRAFTEAAAAAQRILPEIGPVSFVPETPVPLSLDAINIDVARHEREYDDARVQLGRALGELGSAIELSQPSRECLESLGQAPRRPLEVRVAGNTTRFTLAAGVAATQATSFVGYVATSILGGSVAGYDSAAARLTAAVERFSSTRASGCTREVSSAVRQLEGALMAVRVSGERGAAAHRRQQAPADGRGDAERLLIDVLESNSVAQPDPACSAGTALAKPRLARVAVGIDARLYGLFVGESSSIAGPPPMAVCPIAQVAKTLETRAGSTKLEHLVGVLTGQTTLPWDDLAPRRGRIDQQGRTVNVLRYVAALCLVADDNSVRSSPGETTGWLGELAERSRFCTGASAVLQDYLDADAAYVASMNAFSPKVIHRQVSTVSRDVTAPIRQTNWVYDYLTPSVGIAMVLDPSVSQVGHSYTAIQLYGWPNDVEAPMWTRGASDFRRLAGLEFGLVNSLEVGEWKGVLGNSFNNQAAIPLMGLVLQPIPYTTLSGGAMFLTRPESTSGGRRLEARAVPYVGISLQANVPGLIATLVNRRRLASVTRQAATGDAQ